MPHRLIRKSVGTRVLSNPIKNTRRLEAENVTVRAVKMRRESVINICFFFFLFFWRWAVLANRDTGSSQNLRRRRGALTLSTLSPDLVAEKRVVELMILILIKKIAEV